jgi:natural product biosynthesis luciferase-like monooxygenase protein
MADAVVVGGSGVVGRVVSSMCRSTRALSALVSRPKMDFSIMFWGHVRDGYDRPNAYRLAIETAKYADVHGYEALWVPERHFHPWGGLYPNPSVVCAALAAITKRIRLRAGSVVVPLHHPVRIAEEWAVVDNLSQGRVELSVASGWRADDFIFAPDAYEDRKDIMFEGIETLQRLWRGEPHVARNPAGEEIALSIFPKPVQADLPIWVTSAGSMRTVSDAGGGGFGLLTHLLGQSFDDLEKKIAQYRAYRSSCGLDEEGRVSLMLHTFVGERRDAVKETVRKAMVDYLLESADLSIPAGQRNEWEALDDSLKAQRMDWAFERYFETAGLMGTVDDTAAVVERAAKLGVTDICCLVDFGLPTTAILEALPKLTELKERCAGL